MPEIMSAVRLLPWRVAGGALNMALDESLLASAIDGVASLRFYGWTAATLSLGYFQPHRSARVMPRLAPLDWVRRPTGGVALVHHHEVTYALALPAGIASKPPQGSWLVAFHEAAREALAALGVGSRLCQTPLVRGEVLCFLHHTPGDLIVGESKVVGSAQRKGRGALLQHGSILLRQSPHTPELPGIAELSGRDLSREELCDALAVALARRFGWRLEPGEWTPDEERLAAGLSESRYRTAAWNERR
jgi:lipoate-protein ligase A